MRIALETYGGIRCAFRHNHIQKFIEQFPEIFNENNQVDVFVLTTKHESSSQTPMDPETIQPQLNEIWGERLKKFQFFEDLPQEIRDQEEAIVEEWKQIPEKYTLNYDEFLDYLHHLYRNADLFEQLYQTQPFAFKSLLQDIESNNTITLDKNAFVPRYYFRRNYVNEMRKQYQQEHPDAHYDWVIQARFFDFGYTHRKPLDFLYSLPPQVPTIYASIDHMVITTPTIMDQIFEPFGRNYPLVGYEQWFHPQWDASRWDHFFFTQRNISTYCSENQLLWQCLQSCEHYQRITLGGNDLKESFPEGYYFYHFCDERFS